MVWESLSDKVGIDVFMPGSFPVGRPRTPTVRRARGCEPDRSVPAMPKAYPAPSVDTGDDALDIDLLAASLRADTSDLGAFVEALAVKLEEAVPGAVQVQRRREGMFGPKRGPPALAGRRRAALGVALRARTGADELRPAVGRNRAQVRTA